MSGKLILYTTVVAFGGFLIGFDAAVIIDAHTHISNHFKLDNVTENWAMSSVVFGCIIGSIAVALLADKFGRRFMLQIMGGLFFVSALGNALSVNINMIIIFRIIGGLAIGGIFVLSPVYISEISPAKYRGRLSALFPLLMVVGFLTAFAINLALINTGINNWRWMFLSEVLPILIFFVLLFYVGRSPRWLVSIGLHGEAYLVLSEINPGSDVNKLLNEIDVSIDNKAVRHIKYIFKKPFLHVVIIGLLIGLFNHFTGFAVLMIHSGSIFKASGFAVDSVIFQTITIGITYLVFAVLSMSIIDKLGRKKIMLSGAVGMSMILAGFTYIFFNNISGLLPLILMMSFIALYAFSQGTVVWVLFSEIFPNVIRSKGVAVISFFYWIFFALLMYLIPVVQKSFSTNNVMAYIFGVFAIYTMLSVLFFKKYIVESKGKSLEELEKEMLK